MDEKLSGAEGAEYWSLQEAVTRIENAIHFAGGSDSHATGMLRQFVQNARHRMAKIETEGRHQAEVEKEASAQQTAVAMMVERERALSEREQEEYAG